MSKLMQKLMRQNVGVDQSAYQWLTRSLRFIQFEDKASVMPGQTENIISMSIEKDSYTLRQMTKQEKKCCWSLESSNF